MADCYDTTNEISCFVAADGSCSNVFVSHKYDNESSAPSIIYSDAAGAVVDTSTGTVFPGACPVPQVLLKDLCELLADGTEVPFCRQIVTKPNPDGTVTATPVVTDYLPDFSATYSVVDETAVANRPEKCIPLVNSGVQTDWADFT